MGKIRKILSPAEVQATDRRLEQQETTKTNLRRERESNDRLLTPDGSMNVANPEMQAGRRMHRSELVRRIQKMNPNLFYEQSLRFPESGGLYIIDTGSTYGKRMVVAFPHDWVSEFSVTLTSSRLVPSLDLLPVWDAMQQVEGQIRGWRAVLLSLLKDGLLSPGQIDQEFKISQGRSSQRWQQAVN